MSEGARADPLAVEKEDAVRNALGAAVERRLRPPFRPFAGVDPAGRDHRQHAAAPRRASRAPRGSRPAARSSRPPAPPPPVRRDRARRRTARREAAEPRGVDTSRKPGQDEEDRAGLRMLLETSDRTATRARGPPPERRRARPARSGRSGRAARGRSLRGDAEEAGALLDIRRPGAAGFRLTGEKAVRQGEDRIAGTGVIAPSGAGERRGGSGGGPAHHAGGYAQPRQDLP